MSEYKSPIPAMIYNAAVGGHVTNSQQIIDENENKEQSQINAEVKQTLGQGGSVDSRIENAVNIEKTRAQEAEANRYTKNETYTKEEVHNLVTTPNQKYVSIIATAETTSVIDVLPTIGSADTTYRIGNWDGTQYNDSTFSEYAWNGSSYIKLSVKSQVGEVYDISINHADTKYTDLAAALGINGENIPKSLRKGGMSVKYVQSSCNKYMQYRLMSDIFNTNVFNWERYNDVIISNQSFSDLDISDENGNEIARFSGGEFKTKNFDTANTPAQTEDNSGTEFRISDDGGNVIAEFQGGHFRTKEFDSRNVGCAKIVKDTLGRNILLL